MSSAVATYTDKFNKVLHQKGVVGDTFKLLEDNTGVQRLYLGYGIVGLVVFWLAFGFGGQLLTNMIGFVYPAYCSIQALESQRKQDDVQWLTYWVVFAAFSVLEYFADILAGWIPFYWLGKCLFLVWCMAPLESNGASIIYSKVLLPLFQKHSPRIDAAIDKAGAKAGDLFDKAMEKAKDYAAEQQLNKND